MPKTKPWSKIKRKSQKLAAQIVQDQKPIRTYKRREPGEEKAVSSVSKESYQKRHEFCFNSYDLQWELDHTPGAKEFFERHPEQFVAQCNHPEDGLCVHREITDEELKSVNESLSKTISSALPDLENLDKESNPPVRRRRKRTGEKPPLYYFCLKCDKPHTETEDLYKKHISFKRGRGRPKKK